MLLFESKIRHDINLFFQEIGCPSNGDPFGTFYGISISIIVLLTWSFPFFFRSMLNTCPRRLDYGLFHPQYLLTSRVDVKVPQGNCWLYNIVINCTATQIICTSACPCYRLQAKLAKYVKYLHPTPP